jgi:hypothetical protein
MQKFTSNLGTRSFFTVAQSSQACAVLRGKNTSNVNNHQETEIMLNTKPQDVVCFTVRLLSPGQFGVFEQGFEKALAEFSDMDTAEQYALQMADSKANWKVDVYDEAGVLAGTYNSEDDAMPKPAVT